MKSLAIGSPCIENAEPSSHFHARGSGPVIDGTAIPSDQWDPTAPEFSAAVPLMAVSTAHENGWLGPPTFEMDEAEMQSWFNLLMGNDAAKGPSLLALYKKQYPDVRNRMLWLLAESDNTRRRNAQLLARLKRAQGAAPAYLYYFNWASPVHDNRMGSYHTLDISFVFNNVDVAASMSGAAQEHYPLAHVMSAAWAAFARTGNPGHADMPHLHIFDPASYPTMIFDKKVQVRNDPSKEARLALRA